MPTQDDDSLIGRSFVAPASRQARIQSKINKGNGIAAKYLGAPFTQYRPTDPLDPLGNPIGSLISDFDADPAFSHRAPGKYDNAIFYGLFDATYVRRGDYLVGPNRETYFVAGIEPNKPIMCVKCNRSAGFMRPNPNPAGDQFYGGDLRGAETTILAGWPISQLQGTKGERGQANLPGDVRMSDDIGRFWTISSAELTDLGWRLTAVLAET
jgi:hypothetical protein